MKTFLLVVWLYLLIGSFVSMLYAKRLLFDAKNGHDGALRLLRVRRKIGDDKFWTGFYVLTTIFYGFFFIHALLMIGRGPDARMRQD